MSLEFWQKCSTSVEDSQAIVSRGCGRNSVVGVVEFLNRASYLTDSLLRLHDHEMCIDRCVSQRPQGINHQWTCSVCSNWTSPPTSNIIGHQNPSESVLDLIPNKRANWPGQMANAHRWTLLWRQDSPIVMSAAVGTHVSLSVRITSINRDCTGGKAYIYGQVIQISTSSCIVTVLSLPATHLGRSDRPAHIDTPLRGRLSSLQLLNPRLRSIGKSLSS
jgi:hypothetical protein